MHRFATILLVVALLSALVGMTGLFGTATNIAYVCFFAGFLILALRAGASLADLA